MYDIELMRTVLKHFGTVGEPGEPTRTDGVTLSPPTMENSAVLPGHIDRLVELGLLYRTREIHMTNHPDPVTLKATDTGREWVRAALNDEDWLAHVAEFETLVGIDS